MKEYQIGDVIWTKDPTKDSGVTKGVVIKIHPELYPVRTCECIEFAYQDYTPDKEGEVLYSSVLAISPYIIPDIIEFYKDIERELGCRISGLKSQQENYQTYIRYAEKVEEEGMNTFEEMEALRIGLREAIDKLVTNDNVTKDVT